MKKRLLLSILSSLTISFCLVAQTEPSEDWADNIISAEGDTVVIKPLNQGAAINSVFIAIMGDTTATGNRTNPNRVYKTVRGGIYMYNGPANLDITVPNVKIVADDGTDQPPLHIKTTDANGGNAKTFFAYYGNFYLKNQYLCLALTNDTYDRGMFDTKGTDQTLHLDNCVVELTAWTIIQNWSTGLSVKLTNSKFLNIGREPSLEKGPVIDGASSLRELYVENCSFYNFGFLVWNRTHAGPANLYANHNTFINCTQNPFGCYTQATSVITNNLFINTGICPTFPGFYPSLEDEDGLPKGIINVDTVEAAWKTDYYQFDYPVENEVDRKILVDRNNAWWNSRFTTMFDSELTSASPKTWQDQKITMNTRTQAMFDDDAGYPYFTEGAWFNADPGFTSVNSELIEGWAQYIITNSDPNNLNSGNQAPVWRTNMETKLTEIDWPLLADLSYSNSGLLSAGLNKYPLGDLNWFSGYREDWETTDEPSALITARDAGKVPEDYDIFVPSSGTRNIEGGVFSDALTVYPNPVIDFATINFSLEKSINAKLTVYNSQGKEIYSETKTYNAGENNRELNFSNFNVGTYIVNIYALDYSTGFTSLVSVVR